MTFISHSPVQSKKAIPWWVATMPDGTTYRIERHTKSEARAVIKRANKWRRLPYGTVLTRS